MQFFVSPVRALGVIFALLIAASMVTALPQPIEVVARNAVATLNHDENEMLKRQNHSENDMLKRQNHDENDMLKRQNHDENDMLKRQETTML